MQKDYFYIVLVGFASGIFFRSFFDFGKYFSLFFVFLGLVIFIFFYAEKFFKNKDSKTSFRQDPKSSLGQSVDISSEERNNYLEKIFIIGVLILFFGFGMLRFDFSDPKINLFDSGVEKNISINVLVVDEPDIRENNTHLVVKFNNEIKDDKNKNFKSDKKILLITNHYPEFNYGDEIKVRGVLKRPENFDTGSDREFDYVSYLAKSGIYYQMLNPKLELVSSGNGNFVKEKLFAFKKAFLQNIKKVIPEPQASLLGGLVVGAKSSLGTDLQEKFRKVGLIHLVVLSGYNLTIVADSIMGFLSFLPINISLSFGAVGIILFALMTGASATIVRASIMALLVLLARGVGRESKITRALFLAGFLMLIHNPKILVFDPSFQLSFMATIGLIFVSPKIGKYFNFLPEKFGLKETAIATVSTQIFVLPLILYMMGDLSIVAIFVNLLVLIFIPATMLLGFCAGMIGFVSTPISLPFAYITNLFLSYELKVVEIFSSLSFASVHVSYFPFWLAVVVYGFLLLLFLRNKKDSA